MYLVEIIWKCLSVSRSLDHGKELLRAWPRICIPQSRSLDILVCSQVLNITLVMFLFSLIPCN